MLWSNLSAPYVCVVDLSLSISFLYPEADTCRMEKEFFFQRWTFPANTCPLMEDCGDCDLIACEALQCLPLCTEQYFVVSFVCVHLETHLNFSSLQKTK